MKLQEEMMIIKECNDNMKGLADNVREVLNHNKQNKRSHEDAGSLTATYSSCKTHKTSPVTPDLDSPNLVTELTTTDDGAQELRTLTQEVNGLHTNQQHAPLANDDGLALPTQRLQGTRGSELHCPAHLHRSPNVTETVSSDIHSDWVVLDSIASSQSDTESDSDAEAGDDRVNEDNSEGHEDWAEVLSRYRIRGNLNSRHLSMKSKNTSNSTAGHFQRAIGNTHEKCKDNNSEHRQNHTRPASHHQHQHRRQHDVVIGTGHSETIRAVNPRPMNNKATHQNESFGMFSGILVSRLNPHTNAAQLAVHVQRELAIHVRPERMPTRYNDYCSYFIRCNRNDSRKLMNESIWPRNILVKPFYDKY